MWEYFSKFESNYLSYHPPDALGFDPEELDEEHGFVIGTVMGNYFHKEDGKPESWLEVLRDSLYQTNGLGFILSLALFAFLPLPSAMKEMNDYRDLVSTWAERDGSQSFVHGLVVFALGVEVSGM